MAESVSEWAERLTADEVETIIARSLAEHDTKGVVIALHLLARKDAERAQRAYDAIHAGLAIAKGEPVHIEIKAGR